MSQKTINVGSFPDSGNGDTIRDAMIKVNDNFTEIYGSTSSLTNKIAVSDNNLVITGDLIPAADLTYNLGSASKRWHSMYIGANTIYIGDNTVVSGTSLSILGDPNASSLAQMPTLISSRLIAKPFIYTTSGSTVTVRPSIEFQATDGTSYPISFNTSTNEFSLDAAGDHGTGSLVAKKITLTNTGAIALAVNGGIRVDGNSTIGYNASDTMTVKATATFEAGVSFGGSVSLGDGSYHVGVDAGVGNSFTVTSSNFTLSPTGAVIPGNLTVQGNLSIQGTTTTIDSNQVNIGDNIIVLNSDINGGMDPTENAGIQIARGTEAAAKWLWDETNDYWSPMGGNMGNINALTVGTLNATTINGNANSATKLATARTIALTGDITGSASFDGSGNVSITTVAGTVGLATSASTATKLATARTISLTGDATGSASFDGSANATINTSIAFPVTSVAGKTGSVALAIADVTGLQSALDSKQVAGSYAAATHTHAIADVTGLQTALDGKQAAGSYAAAVHTHVSADITDAASANTASTLVKRDASGNFSAGTITAALTGNASTATKLATARTISTTGDATGSASFDGSANSAIALTLATSGVTAGSYGSTTSVPAITVDAKGRVTAASSTAIAFPVTTVAGRTGAVTIASADITDATSLNTASTIVERDASGNFSAGTITAALTGNASTATKLATARTFTLSGAVSGSASFDGSAAPTITTTLGTIAAPTFTGSVTIGGSLAGSIEMGQQGTANTPYIDFHSSASSTDYDSRILASGGTSTVGQGTLNYYASTHAFNGDMSMSGGVYSTASDNDGTISSGTYTPTPVGGNFKHISNGGAFTLAAPTAAGMYTLVIEIVNSATAGAVTFSGFAKTFGDGISSTSGQKFQVFIVKTNSGCTATVSAMQ